MLITNFCKESIDEFSENKPYLTLFFAGRGRVPPKYVRIFAQLPAEYFHVRALGLCQDSTRFRAVGILMLMYTSLSATIPRPAHHTVPSWRSITIPP